MSDRRRAQWLAPSLTTERLTLRWPQLSDAASVHEARVETWDELRRWFEAGAPPTPDESAAYVAQWIARNSARTDMQWFAFDASGRFVGCIGLLRVQLELPGAELGFWLRRSAWGHGYAVEAARAALNYARESLGCVRIELRTDASNAAARSVAERLAGMRLEAVQRAHHRHHLTRALCDNAVYVWVRDNDDDDAARRAA